MRKGEKMSEEMKQRLRVFHTGLISPLRGKKRPEMVGDKNPMYGRTHSPEAILKMKKARALRVMPKGIIFSKERRMNISLGRKGKYTGSRNNKWRGGITPIHKAIRESYEYKMWRESVFERDQYACVWCGDAKGGNLQADHIKPFAFFPELRFELSNGRTLCKDCHKKTDTYGERAKKYKNIQYV